MGSAVSIAAGLILTWVVFLFLSDSAARFAPERLPLARGDRRFLPDLSRFRHELLWGAAGAALALRQPPCGSRAPRTRRVAVLALSIETSP